MNTYNLKLEILAGIMFFCGEALAMTPVQSAEHDKYITQVEIDGRSLPQFEQIFILPFTGGPRRNVQEAPGVTLSGIQDYAVTEQAAGRWKPGQTLIYKLEKPILVNITTHNPELLVGIKELGKTTVDTWPFDIDDFIGESNIIRVNLSAPQTNKVAIVTSKKK